jgi:LAS superfamily LD-carboxypeptidase LdcB
MSTVDTPFADEASLDLPPGGQSDAEAETPFAEAVPEFLPPEPDDEIPWTNSAEQTAFREAVLKAHVERSSTRRQPGRDLTGPELVGVTGTRVSMRRDAADQAGRLLAAAIEALAQARQAGHDDALKTRRISASSGYRGSEYQRKVWRRNFPGYYRRTARQREALSTGPHGAEAVRHMLETFHLPRWVAAPGFSNHQAGIAIDFQQEREGTPIRNSSRLDALAAWRRTWFHGWLTENAARFGFQPYAREPWHWEYRPGGGPRSEASAEASDESDLSGVDEYESGAEPESSEDAATEDFESDEDFSAEELEQPHVDGFHTEDEPVDMLSETVDDQLHATLQLVRLEPELQVPEFLDRIWGILSFNLGQTLQAGSNGSAVRVLQQALGRLGHTVMVDGNFGAPTRDAVRAFQQRHGLCPRGVAGSQTKIAIVRALTRLGNAAADPLPEAIVRTARAQNSRWRTGAQWLHETDTAATPILQEYYLDGCCATVAAGALQSAAWQQDNYWSAVFVSWVMRSAGAGQDFAYSHAHRVYVRAARNNRCTNNIANPFWAYRATEVAPEPGDLVCRSRHSPPVTYENIVQPVLWGMHCDIVTAPASAGQIMVTGGNVAVPGATHQGLTVAERPLRVLANGMLELQGNQANLMAVLRCRGPAANVPQPC